MLHQIGNGALGPVFRAYDQDRDRLVAVKLFRLDLPPERVHQLISEFEKLIAAELQHPAIAAPRATGIDNNSAYLAQDFAAADSLDVVIRENGAAPPAQAVRVAAQLAEALDYAADRQIVHGALHPRDILLSDDDAWIVGLGVARALERVGVTAPVRRPYAPPERINDGGWDRSADVFSLAAIVFELLCGKRVAGTGSEAAESLPEIPGADMEALQRVFALALAADPSYRYATATAFTDALKDAMGIDIAPARPKAKRRSRLRVVADEPELPLAVSDEVHEVPEVPEEELDLQQVGAPEPPKVRAPRKRRAPAPTPVAIETVVQPPAEVEELALNVVEAPMVELGTIAFAEPVAAVEHESVAEPQPVIEPEPVVEPELVVAPEPEPEAVAQLPVEFAPVEPVANEEPFAVEEPVMIEPVLATLKPLALSPEPPAFSPEPVALSPEPEPAGPELSALRPQSFASPEPVPVYVTAPPPHHSAVWPIGVAALIGIALGFGAGYTVAIRDRAGAPVAVVAPPVPVEPAKPAPKDFTEVAAVPPPPPPAPKVVEPPAVAPVFAGRVLVRSTPSGARVTVDGKDQGQTPATIRELGQGEHRIRITRDGYATAERRVVLSPKEPSQSLSVALKRDAKAGVAPAAAGMLIVESRPQGAAVIVDGRSVGTTPLSLADVRVGRHAIRLEREGYRVWTAGVTISAGEQNRVTASLEK